MDVLGVLIEKYEDEQVPELTEETSLIRQQLEAVGDERERLEAELARRLTSDELPLLSNISTDEITPGWDCFYYDETLGQYVYELSILGYLESVVQNPISPIKII